MFDKKIEKAIEILWIKEERNMGSKAIELLEEAANEGNGDACFFLARCCFGECYIDPIFGFPEEDEKGYAYLEKSMEMGSAVGMMGAMRVGGFTPARGTYVYPPYNSTKQIWEEVAQKAKEGQVFCKYMIANSYYYGDVIELLHIPRGEITDSKIREFQYEAARLYEECIKSGLGFGVHNLEDIYTSGDYGIPKNPIII